MLGVDGSYNLGKLKAAEASFTTSHEEEDEIYTTTGSGRLRYKNDWGIHVTPGYVVDKSVMLYGKLSYNQMKGEASGSIGDDESRIGGSVSEKFHGFGFGFGARVNLANNLFIDGVLEQIHYKSKSFDINDETSLSIRPKSTGGKITLVYRF